MDPPRPDRAGPRGIAAVAFSLILHLGVAWWFARLRPAPVDPAPAPPAPIEIQVVQVPTAPTPPAAPISRPPPSRRRASPPPPPAERAEAGSPPSGAAPPSGTPRRIDLLPPPSLGPDLDDLGGVPIGSGRTILNRPQTPEERALALAGEARRVKERVDGWIEVDKGLRRVETGLVDPYFGAVRGALQAAVERGAPDGMPGRNVGQQLIDAVMSGASAYGQTGNPYGEGQVPNAEPAAREFTNPAADLARRYPDAGGTRQLQQCIDQGKLLDDFLDGKFGGGLTSIVELDQAPDGALRGVRLVAPSGLPTYDRHVLSIAPAALKDLPPPPSKGFGIKEGGLKSLWAFEGRVKFKRPLKEWNPLTGGLTGTLVGALYGLACPGLGPPITFDPVTGELELIDLAHPKFTCKVKLLRVE